MAADERFHGMDVELRSRARWLEGSAKLAGGQLITLRLTWQAWETATGQPGPTLPPPDDRIALRAAWLAAIDRQYVGRTVDGFRLVEADYIREAELASQAD
jgi:hypothetical protein